ncbi:hypothetical protein EDD21DRAFT_379620 [Dissophora ornata]|nr:hypothetical protein EDD21DRAFT_379620 [Dissophora ornata]
MALSQILPKDALVLCTVSLLFIYFAVILWTNYSIILPYWTPLFWAAALSVPLHALKARLLPPIHEALENDFLDIVASVIGSIVYFILRFFLGSYIANPLKTLFLGYCSVVYVISARQPNTTTNGKSTKEKVSEYDSEADTHDRNQLSRMSNHDGDEEEGTDDYELHPNYQALVDNEHDKYARPANFPSYINLMRAAVIYVLLQFTTLTELREFAEEVLSRIQIGTANQMFYLVTAIIVHITYSSLRQIVFVAERLFYPKLTPKEQKEVSIFTTVPRNIQRLVQESLNSTLATIIVLTTLSVLGLLVTILSVGVVHDAQGIVAQTHQRVTYLREEQLRQSVRGEDNAAEGGHIAGDSKDSRIQQADGALEQAYDAGVNWFDPILKEAFPELAWGAVDWAYHVANVVVDPNDLKLAATTEPEAPVILEHTTAPEEVPAPVHTAVPEPETAVETPACEEKSDKVAVKESVELSVLLEKDLDATKQFPLVDNLNASLTCPQPTKSGSSSSSPSPSSTSSCSSSSPSSVPSSTASALTVTPSNTTSSAPVNPPVAKTPEKPELWVIPTLESLGFSGLKNKRSYEFHSQQEQKQIAINLSQGRFLLSILLGYHGLDTSTMLWGFNAFNDLLFRWILFLLALITFTGLKVSPLQRIGWMIDQSLASPNSGYYGSSQLSTSTSPGRVLAKNIEFAISGTFISMFKLSIYHTIFTQVWTRFLTNRVLEAIAFGTASSPDFVVPKYAWFSSLFGIVLVLFPIAPNWLVAVPGAVIHFYVYGQRPMEAIALVVGHIVMSALVDGPVWDSHVVKNARPGVSSAFWLGLWCFLGGMKWGPKGLLLGPVFFAAVPAVWSALLELRGWPSTTGTVQTRSSSSSNSTTKSQNRGASKSPSRLGSSGYEGRGRVRGAGSLNHRSRR